MIFKLYKDYVEIIPDFAAAKSAIKKTDDFMM